MSKIRGLRQHYKRVKGIRVSKKGFDGIEEAKLEGIRSNRPVYFCDICQKYHVGRAPKEEK